MTGPESAGPFRKIVRGMVEDPPTGYVKVVAVLFILMRL